MRQAVFKNHCILWFLSERLILQGDVNEAGCYEGQGVAQFDNDCVYEGNFLNGMFSGNGKFSWADGSSFEGDFEVGMVSKMKK